MVAQTECMLATQLAASSAPTKGGNLVGQKVQSSVIVWAVSSEIEKAHERDSTRVVGKVSRMDNYLDA